MVNVKSGVDASEVLARLLATEKITLIKSNVSTASFDIVKRIVYLPNWKDMSSEEEIMLILHEMSHALFTTHSEYEKVFTQYGYIKSYCNVIEDARVEILMKDRYPGSSRQFLQGYVSLHKRDFFNVKAMNYDTLLTIDKLNLFYKIGALHPIPLNQDEQVFADRMYKVKTIQEVIDLALEIWEYSKQKMLENEDDVIMSSSQQSSDDNDDDDESEQNEDDGNDSSSGDGSDYSSSASKNDGDGSSNENAPAHLNDDNLVKELESKTDKSFYSNLKDNADLLTRIRYLDLEPTHAVSFEDVIVPYKNIIQDITSKIDVEVSDGYSRDTFRIRKSICSKFRKQNQPFVSYMIKEFEMKKAATAYKRAQVSKTGQLDTRKLFAYKIKDELFKQTTKLQNQKNHGMIFLLDWSGSMNDSLHETLQQCISLASFCHKSQIPFQVLAFSDYYSNRDCPKFTEREERRRLATAKNADNINGLICGRFNLLEFFSHTMSTTEFNTMTDILLSKVYRRSGPFRKYHTGGTPLNESIFYMVDYIGKFKKMHNVEKMSFITLTDGAGCVLNNYDDPTAPSYRAGSNSHTKTILRDTKTGRQYNFEHTEYEQINTLNQIIKDRYDAKIIKFFLTNCGNNSVGAARAAKMLLLSFAKYRTKQTYLKMDTIVKKLAAQIMNDSFAYVENIDNHDQAYVIDSKTKLIDLEDYMSTAKDRLGDELHSDDVSIAAKLFSNGLNASKKSRVILGRFIEVIA